MIDKYGRNACACGFVPPTHTHADDCPVMHPPLRPSDSLRDRIAAVACGATSAGKLFPWDTLSEPQKDSWRAMADAVIAELEPLRIQLLAYARSGVEYGDMTPTSEKVLKRILQHYWKADDE